MFSAHHFEPNHGAKHRGLQYDLDGSRLIALHTESDTGAKTRTTMWKGIDLNKYGTRD